MTETAYSLVLPFDTDDPQFVRGAQAGMIWERLEQTGLVDGQPVCASNAEMVMRMAEAKGLPFSAETLSDEWISVTIGMAVT